jgi:hypothetical protein
VFSDDLIEEFYNSGWFGPISELAVEVFQKCVSTVAQQGNCMIKVLEVSAGMIFQPSTHIYHLAHLFSTGTGLLTQYFCNSLNQRDDIIVQYVVSDMLFALANSAAKSTKTYC